MNSELSVQGRPPGLIYTADQDIEKAKYKRDLNPPLFGKSAPKPAMYRNGGVVPIRHAIPGRGVRIPTMHTGQQAAFNARTRFQVLRCGRRWGKTDYSKIMAGDRVMKGQYVGIFVPNYKIQTEVYADLEEMLHSVKKSASKSEWIQRFNTGGRIDFWSLENDRAGRGRKYDLVLVDEAAFGNPNLMHVWNTAIKPTLLDRQGQAIVMSTPNGNDPDNFFYAICTQQQHEFVEFHAPTRDNPYLHPPYLPAGELERLALTNHPLVYRQEYLAEFVDWSGVAFFQLDNLLVDGKPVAVPQHIDFVFATIDTAVKDGQEHDGTAVTYWGRSKYLGHPLVILDWDIVQIEGSLLEIWLPTVFQNLDRLAQQTKARFGSGGAFIEDKASGTILIQQALRRGLNAHSIDSQLTSLGKDARAISVSGYVYQGQVKISEPAYNKTVNFKNQQKNHLVGQVVQFVIGDKKAATRADDLVDTFTYGVAIALGDGGGF